MSEWQEVKLGELVDIGSSKRIFYEDYVNVGIPFYRSKEVIEKYNGNDISTDLFITKEKFEQIKEKYGAPQTGDLLLTSVGTLGIPYIVQEGEEFYFKDGNLTWFKNYKSNLYNEFLYYWIISPIGKNALDMMSIGSTQAALTIQGLKNLDFDVPPIEEQKAIASVLSSLDDKIDLLHRQNTTLECMAETLFRQWFVEEAQEDWVLHKLGDCVTISYGKNLPTKNLLDDGFPVFGANGQIGFYDRYTYDEPQVLVSCRGEASGKVNVSLPKSYVTNNSLVLEQNKIPEISFEFLKYWALSYDFDLHVSGSAQPQITIDGLYGADFTVPPKKLIEKFTETVNGLETKKLNNFFQIKTLEKLRDNLLPKLMSGEVRVDLEGAAA